MGAKGIVFYPEHVRAARGLLDDAELGLLFFAVTNYAETGQLPADERSKAWQVCFDLMRESVDKNMERYRATCERNRQNIARRWRRDEASSGTVDTIGIRSNTTVYERTSPYTADTNQAKPNVTEPNQTKPKNDALPLAPSPADDPPWVTEAVDRIPQIQRAEQLMLRYKLPDSNVSLEALLQDIDRHGEQNVEQALKDASASNSRPMLSVNYYRAVLNGRGRSDAFDDYIRV